MHSAKYTWSPIDCWCGKNPSWTLNVPSSPATRERSTSRCHPDYVKCRNCKTVRAATYINEVKLYYETDFRLDVADKRDLTLINRTLAAIRLFKTGAAEHLRERAQINFILQSIRKPISVYDHGCGDGAFILEWMRRGLGWKRVRGWDLSKGFVLGDGVCPFELAAASHVLEHARNPISVLHEMRCMSKQIFLEVPRFIEGRTVDLKHGRLNLRPNGQFEFPHIWYWTTNTFRNMLNKAGLEVIAQDHGCDPIRILALWQDSMDI